MMNTLSWLLYLADIADNLGTISIMFLIFSFFAVAAVLIQACVLGEMSAPPEQWALWRKFTGYTAFAFFFSSLLVTMTPSQETVYAIIVSEMGEDVVESDIGSKALQGLENWLDDQIGNTTETKE